MISIMKHLIRLCLVSIIMLFSALGVYAQTFNVSTLVWGDLPRTCLPSRADIDAVSRTDHNFCHCPPENFCTDTVIVDSVTHDRLPPIIKKLCCLPTTPTPPTPPSGQNDQCDVLYYRRSTGHCNEYTKLGPRTAVLCKEYGTPSIPLCLTTFDINGVLVTNCSETNASIGPVNALNYALSLCHNTFEASGYEGNTTNFDKVIDDINNINDNVLPKKNYVTASKEYQNTDANINQDTFRALMACRNNYFTAFASQFYTTEEQNLHSWVNIPLTGGVGEAVKTIRRPPDEPDNAANLINQEPGTFELFWNNTYNPNLHSSPPYPMVAEFSFADNKYDSSTTISGNVDNKYSKHTSALYKDLRGLYGANLSLSFRPMENVVASDPHATTPVTDAPVMPVPVIVGTPPLTCVEKQAINLCMMIETPDDTCQTCLAPSTKILMADKTETAIETLKIGDMVQLPNHKISIIEKLVKKQWPELRLYNINNGALKLTADHPIMTQNGWRAIDYNFQKDDLSPMRYGIADEKVKPLKVGDVIITHNGTITVKHIMPEASVKSGITYNLKLKDGDRFYANGILVKGQK